MARTQIALFLSPTGARFAVVPAPPPPEWRIPIPQPLCVAPPTSPPTRAVWRERRFRRVLGRGDPVIYEEV